MHAWSVGDHLTHRFNPELGTGRVTAIEGRVLVVHFPQGGATLRLAATSDALVPEAERSRRRDRSLLERLAAGEVDETEDFLTRLDILRLLATREASGLGSFLGGRVRLFPHQLHVAERATARMPVRWLLADEVGLGKTIEAALIMNRLLHTQKIERCLVVAPEALDRAVAGRAVAQVPPGVHAARSRRASPTSRATSAPASIRSTSIAARSIALETLVERPQLAGAGGGRRHRPARRRRGAAAAAPPRHPGEPAYRAIAPIAALGRHVLLLSATPLEDDAHGFFRLLQLLRPDEFPEALDVEARLASGVPLPPCTSSTRRVDIGGLPPRVPIAIDLPADGGLDALGGRALQARLAPAAVPGPIPWPRGARWIACGGRWRPARR